MSVPDSKPVVNVVIGTAGHIDHGKSALVECLTGMHPSRLKEEQERGMTIDIGYAELKISDRVTAGIIDVPGHERFIRNMVAGASGVDLVLLVVAADDGVMPQTREHLEIMRLLGIDRGMTVITKIDMVDEELLEIVCEDVADYLRGTFLDGRPMMRVSNTTREGIDALRELLVGELADVAARDSTGVFRMPVQRSFTVKGHGTVVTGVPISGRVDVGDELELLPGDRPVRVRGIQVHHALAEFASVGHRTALNLTDVNYRDVHRGHVVAAAGYFSSAALLEARIEYLPHFETPLRNDTPIRFHCGTADVGGHVVVLDKKVVLPGETALVQLRLEEPVVVTAGDRYILRLASPMVTLGGGTIIGETKWRLKRFREWLTDNIERKEEHLGDETGYLEYVVRSQGSRFAGKEDLALTLKVSVDHIGACLNDLKTKGRVRAFDRDRSWIHADMFKKACADVGDALLRLHDAERLQAGFHPTKIAKESMLELPLVEAVVAEMSGRGRFEVLSDRRVRHNKFTGGLSKEDARVVRQIEEMHQEEHFASPILSVIVEETSKPQKKVKELISYLVQMGQLVPLTADLCVHRDAVAEAERRLVHRILDGGPMESKEFKDIIGATRKYVIPLLEYFDKKGVTKRDDNVRALAADWEKNAYESTLEA